MLDKQNEISEEEGQDKLSPRHKEILENALELLVSGGDKALTTAGLAKASNCSKETLYKWFGDRKGILAAMMAYQGSKVGAAFGDEVFETDHVFRAYLTDFASDLLSVLSGDMSLALNRLAIGQAGSDNSELGLLLIQKGRGVIREKGIRFLEAAREKGYLSFADAEEAYHVLYGLIVSDFHVRILLGEKKDAGKVVFRKQADRAISQFYQLYGPTR